MTETYQSLWRGPVQTPTNGWGVKVSTQIRDQIASEVAEKYGVRAEQLITKGGNHKVAHARHEVMWRLRDRKASDGRPRHSYPAIAEALGGIDHTTVLHGVRRHEARLAGE